MRLFLFSLYVFFKLKYISALLSGTLRTFQRAACDDQVIILKCPDSTSISVQVAQYGKSADALAALCPDPANPHRNVVINNTCFWPNALQTVVEACQKKRQCKFQTSPKTFGGDPCPGTRKYVEIAFKCRPNEFRSRVACENEVLQLTCNPNTRLAVYSASFGRTEYESYTCPQPQGVREETCLVSYATETVMQICHGKRSCTLSADSATFGNPCHPQSRMYLKVVYTCVPRSVLREQYEERPEKDETLEPEQDIDTYDVVDDALRESSVYSASPNLGGARPGGANITGGPSESPPKYHIADPQPKGRLSSLPPLVPVTPRPPSDLVQGDSGPEQVTNCTVTPYYNEKTRVIGFISEWIHTYNFLSKNREKLILYLSVSVSAGLLSLLVLVISRLLWQRRRRHVAANTTLPNYTPYVMSLLTVAENREKLILYLSVSVSAGLLSLLVLVISRLLWQRRRRHVAANTTLPNYTPSVMSLLTVAENREKLILYLSVSVSAGLLSLLVLVISRLLWQRRRRHVAANTTLPNYTPYVMSLLTVAENREKLILYLSVSVSAGLLSLLVLVISRLLWQRRRRHVAANTTLPNYADDLSEVDTDIDLTTPATITILSSPLPPGEVVRFGSDCSAPRSLSRSGNNQYYYG